MIMSLPRVVLNSGRASTQRSARPLADQSVEMPQQIQSMNEKVKCVAQVPPSLSLIMQPTNHRAVKSILPELGEGFIRVCLEALGDPDQVRDPSLLTARAIEDLRAPFIEGSYTDSRGYAPAQT
jgi:hypothetical protein